MRVDICVPAHNEAEIIGDAVRLLEASLSSLPHETRITVVSNGSTDDTAARAHAAGANVLEIEAAGKGRSVVAAAQKSESEIFGFIDADLSADPSDIPALCTELESGAYDIVIGSRLLNTDVVDRAGLRTLSSRVFNALQRVILGISVRDTQCGLKLMNAKGRSVLRTCEESGWFFDLELLAKAEAKGLRVLEMPIHWNEYRFPGRKSKLSMIRDGYGALRAMLRIRSRLRT